MREKFPGYKDVDGLVRWGLHCQLTEQFFLQLTEQKLYKSPNKQAMDKRF